jgi:hypothetical protein
VPKDTFRFYGDGTLKMYCFVAHFRFYADVTLKSGKWAMLSLHPKDLGEENLLKKGR